MDDNIYLELESPDAENFKEMNREHQKLKNAKEFTSPNHCISFSNISTLENTNITKDDSLSQIEEEMKIFIQNTYHPCIPKDNFLSIMENVEMFKKLKRYFNREEIYTIIDNVYEENIKNFLLDYSFIKNRNNYTKVKIKINDNDYVKGPINYIVTFLNIGLKILNESLKFKNRLKGHFNKKDVNRVKFKSKTAPILELFKGKTKSELIGKIEKNKISFLLKILNFDIKTLFKECFVKGNNIFGPDYEDIFTIVKDKQFDYVHTSVKERKKIINYLCQ